MDKPIQFRRRGRGYDRDDVNEFISRENIRFNKLEESYNKRIRELESRIEALTNQIQESEDDKSTIVNLELELSEAKDKIDALNVTISEKDAIIDGLKSALDKSKNNLDTANALIDDLRQSSSLSANENSVPVHSSSEFDDSILEKAQKYDSICDNIDEIFAFAKEEANRIIAEALEMRKKMIKSSPSQVKSEISGKTDSIIEELRRKLRRPSNKK